MSVRGGGDGRSIGRAAQKRENVWCRRLADSRRPGYLLHCFRLPVSASGERATAVHGAAGGRRGQRRRCRCGSRGRNAFARRERADRCLPTIEHQVTASVASRAADSCAGNRDPVLECARILCDTYVSLREPDGYRCRGCTDVFLCTGDAAGAVSTG